MDKVFEAFGSFRVVGVRKANFSAAKAQFLHGFKKLIERFSFASHLVHRLKRSFIAGFAYNPKTKYADGFGDNGIYSSVFRTQDASF